MGTSASQSPPPQADLSLPLKLAKCQKRSERVWEQVQARDEVGKAGKLRLTRPVQLRKEGLGETETRWARKGACTMLVIPLV